jgi:ABC-2 type transport system ATP-binding protein
MEQMSRGMQQKVAIARALLSRPALLLLDEPTTGLDPRSKREVQAFILELRSEFGTTILLTTHDMAEADGLCDRIAILEGGHIAALDTPDGLKRLVADGHGHEPTLEDVFLQLTGKALVHDTVEVEGEPA